MDNEKKAEKQLAQTDQGNTGTTNVEAKTKKTSALSKVFNKRTFTAALAATAVGLATDNLYANGNNPAVQGAAITETLNTVSDTPSLYWQKNWEINRFWPATAQVAEFDKLLEMANLWDQQAIGLIELLNPKPSKSINGVINIHPEVKFSKKRNPATKYSTLSFNGTKITNDGLTNDENAKIIASKMHIIRSNDDNPYNYVDANWLPLRWRDKVLSWVAEYEQNWQNILLQALDIDPSTDLSGHTSSILAGAPWQQVTFALPPNENPPTPNENPDQLSEAEINILHQDYTEVRWIMEFLAKRGVPITDTQYKSASKTAAKAIRHLDWMAKKTTDWMFTHINYAQPQSLQVWRAELVEWKAAADAVLTGLGIKVDPTPWEETEEDKLKRESEALISMNMRDAKEIIAVLENPWAMEPEVKENRSIRALEYIKAAIDQVKVWMEDDKSENNVEAWNQLLEELKWLQKVPLKTLAELKVDAKDPAFVEAYSIFIDTNAGNDWDWWKELNWWGDWGWSGEQDWWKDPEWWKNPEWWGDKSWYDFSDSLNTAWGSIKNWVNTVLEHLHIWALGSSAKIQLKPMGKDIVVTWTWFAWLDDDAHKWFAASVWAKYGDFKFVLSWANAERWLWSTMIMHFTWNYKIDSEKVHNYLKFLESVWVLAEIQKSKVDWWWKQDKTRFEVTFWMDWPMYRDNIILGVWQKSVKTNWVTEKDPYLRVQYDNVFGPRGKTKVSVSADTTQEYSVLWAQKMDIWQNTCWTLSGWVSADMWWEEDEFWYEIWYDQVTQNSCTPFWDPWDKPLNELVSEQHSKVLAKVAAFDPDNIPNPTVAESNDSWGEGWWEVPTYSMSLGINDTINRDVTIFYWVSAPTTIQDINWNTVTAADSQTYDMRVTWGIARISGNNIQFRPDPWYVWTTTITTDTVKITATYKV